MTYTGTAPAPPDYENMTPEEAARRIKAKQRLQLARCIDFPSLIGNPSVKTLSPNQIFSVASYDRLQAIEKGRQEGQSMGYSIDSVLRAINEPGSNGVHVSTDKWESEKKQKYCLRAFDCLNNEVKSSFRITSEAKTHIEIEAKDDLGIRSISSIDFLACRPPRGADKAGIYLHEGAHMPNVVEILKAAKGCTAHAGYIRMCGTHQGNETEFYSIVKNLQDENGRYPHRAWHVGFFPWWTFPGFCLDVVAAMAQAPYMETAERVEMFGNWALKDLYESYAEEDFQEEFECIVLDAKHSFYSDALIKSCQPQTEEAIKSHWFETVTCEGKNADPVREAIELIDVLARQILSRLMPGEWLWSMDVGRKKDTSEITIGQKLNGTNIIIPRVIITLDNIPFPLQEKVCRHLLDSIPVTKGHIDATGMGMHLSEVLFTDYGMRAMPVTFTNAIKSNLANGLKIRMQKGGIVLPIFSPLTRQIHSIKKTVTIYSREVYDVQGNASHHGDKFWSLALLCALEDPNGLEGGTYLFVPEVVQRSEADLPKIIRPGDTSYNRPWGAPRPWDRGGGGRESYRRRN